jgi:hypothetical protein
MAGTRAAPFLGLGVVGESGGNVALERRFAALAGMHLAHQIHEPGSVADWGKHRIRTGTAFVVELPAGTVGAPAAARFVYAILTIGQMLR